MATKVLLVEDDPVLADAIREGLSDEGIITVGVSSVSEALEAMRTQRPDTLILDLMLADRKSVV